MPDQYRPMTRWERIELLRRRLADWEAELRSNKYGMAGVAERAIAVLRIEIEWRKTHYDK